MTIIGIDPGKSGGIAWITNDGKACAEKMLETIKGYYRPLTFKEWCHSTSFSVVGADTRSEFRKIREIIREGRWPKTRRAVRASSLSQMNA